MGTATITNVRIVAAHDGAAELMVTLGYANGTTNDVPLDQYASAELMRHCDASDFEELLGRTWDDVRIALKRAYNRFNDANAP